MSFGKNYDVVSSLPNAQELKEIAQLNLESVNTNRREICDILSGRDSRFLYIVGPCSAWPSKAVLTFSEELKVIQSRIQDSGKIVMRCYLQKPRTTVGWKGPLFGDPGNKEANLGKGVRESYKMMVDIINSTGLPLADEALYQTSTAFQDLISYLAIGARTTESQPHRELASSIDFAVGMKNPTSGKISRGVESVIAAQAKHDTIIRNGGGKLQHIRTYGNPNAHLILRGGDTGPNFEEEYIVQARRLLEKANVSNPAIVVDCNHDNSDKNHNRQLEIARRVMEINKDSRNGGIVKGIMLEGFNLPGNQKPGEDMEMRGLSVTDPCSGIDEIRKLLFELN